MVALSVQTFAPNVYLLVLLAFSIIGVNLFMGATASCNAASASRQHPW